MTSAAAAAHNVMIGQFAQHFDQQKRESLAGIAVVSQYLARFAHVSDARSERTKQTNRIKSAEFEEKICGVDRVRLLIKALQQDAELIGLAGTSPAQVACEAARREMKTLLTDLLVAWRTHKAAGWTPESAHSMLLDASERCKAIRGALNNVRAALGTLRVSITRQLRSPAFRAIAATPSPEFREKHAAIVFKAAATLPRAQNGTPADAEDSDDEPADADDLRSHDTVNTNQEEDEDGSSSASGFVVVDDASIEKDSNASESSDSSSSSDTSSESSDSDDETESDSAPAEPLPRRVMPDRKRKAEAIEGIVNAEKELRARARQERAAKHQSKQRRANSDDEQPADDAAASDETSESLSELYEPIARSAQRQSISSPTAPSTVAPEAAPEAAVLAAPTPASPSTVAPEAAPPPAEPSAEDEDEASWL